MFGNFHLFGHRAHLVLEDENGAFEVATPFVLDLDGKITLKMDRVQAAIAERNASRTPIQRAVKLTDA